MILKLKGEQFFFYYCCILLILIVGGFGIHGFVKYEEMHSVTLLIAIHGIVMVIWYSLVLFQAWLIRVDNVTLHMGLGYTSIVLALILIVSGILIGVESYKGSGKAINILGNFLNMLNFAILYSFAIFFRKKAGTHKRLILLASIAMLAPALVRIVRTFGADEFITLPLWLLTLIILPIYDFRKLKRVQLVTILGTCLILIGLILNITVGMSEGWSSLMESIIGPK